MYTQWNPVNTVTSGPKKLAVLTGWPYYQGRLKFHDLKVLRTNTLGIHRKQQMNNWNLDMVYSN